MRDIVRTLGQLVAIAAVVYFLTAHYASQKLTLPEPFSTVQAETYHPAAVHDVKTEALKKYERWESDRKYNWTEETQAFHEFKTYWEKDVPISERTFIILRIYHRPEGVIPDIGKEPVSFKSANIFDQFQEFLNESYTAPKTGV